MRHTPHAMPTRAIGRQQLITLTLASIFAVGAVAQAQELTPEPAGPGAQDHDAPRDAVVAPADAEVTLEGTNEAVPAEAPAVTPPAPVTTEAPAETAQTPAEVTPPPMVQEVIEAPAEDLVAQDGGTEEEIVERTEEELFEQDYDSAMFVTGVTGNPEDGPEMADTEDQLTWSVESRSEFYSSENMDLRETINTSNEDVYWTDDRHIFAYSMVTGGLSYQPNEQVDFNLSLSHAGLWGSDQLGYEANETGVLRFYELNTVYRPLDVDGIDATIAIGRQRFEIGSVPRDYMLADTVDALVLGAQADAGFGLRVLAFDLFTANDLPDGAFTSYIGGTEVTNSLQGETNTIRHGAVLDANRDLNEALHLDAALYYFFAIVGGGPRDGTGSDITQGGELGNFSDRDNLTLMGGRVSATYSMGDMGMVQLYGEGAQSSGVDRKYIDNVDAEANGLALGGGLLANLDLSGVGVDLAADFYTFEGSERGSDGLLYDHGFISFKGDRVGGLILNRFMGWRPSVILDDEGFVNTPHGAGDDTERSAGTQVIHAGLGLSSTYGLGLQVDYWTLTDTSSSFISQADYDSGACGDLAIPFGENSSEFCATERFGRALGDELDVTLTWDANENLQFYGAYGMFNPGEFFELVYPRTVGYLYGGQEQAWAMSFGALTTF